MGLVHILFCDGKMVKGFRVGGGTEEERGGGAFVFEASSVDAVARGFCLS